MRAVLELEGSAAEIPYYSINGRRLLLSRGLVLSYHTEEFDDGDTSYLEMTKAYNTAVGSGNSHKVALLYLITLLRHTGKSAGENPRVEAVERLFLAAAKIEYGNA